MFIKISELQRDATRVKAAGNEAKNRCGDVRADDVTDAANIPSKPGQNLEFPNENRIKAVLLINGHFLF